MVVDLAGSTSGVVGICQQNISSTSKDGRCAVRVWQSPGNYLLMNHPITYYLTADPWIKAMKRSIFVKNHVGPILAEERTSPFPFDIEGKIKSALFYRDYTLSCLRDQLSLQFPSWDKPQWLRLFHFSSIAPAARTDPTISLGRNGCIIQPFQIVHSCPLVRIKGGPLNYAQGDIQE